MSTADVQYYTSMSQQIAIYMGIPILIAGTIGNVFNLIVFLSLKTFQENACAFFLTMKTAADLGQLLSGLFTRIMISGFNIDWTSSSVFYCKFRAYLFQFFALTSFECMSLATISQFLATSSNHYLHSLSNTKLAHRIVIWVAIVWLIHGIPYAIYYGYIQSPTTDAVTCDILSPILDQYDQFGVTVFFSGLLPISINCVFGLLAFRNVQQLDRHAMPIAQRELNKQLTSIIFIQFIYHMIATVPNILTTILSETSIVSNDPVGTARLTLSNIIVLCIYYLNYAIPFYMYICVSHRFRRQFIYAFFDIYMKRWRRQAQIGNQVVPEA